MSAEAVPGHSHEATTLEAAVDRNTIEAIQRIPAARMNHVVVDGIGGIGTGNAIESTIDASGRTASGTGLIGITENASGMIRTMKSTTIETADRARWNCVSFT